MDAHRLSISSLTFQNVMFFYNQFLHSHLLFQCFSKQVCILNRNIKNTTSIFESKTWHLKLIDDKFVIKWTVISIFL